MTAKVLLIVIALLAGFLGVTGKYKCFTVFFTCIFGAGDCLCGSGEGFGGAASPGGPIIVTPGGSGPLDGGVYRVPDVIDARDKLQALPPLESFV
jgi:hypothetical protein